MQKIKIVLGLAALAGLAITPSTLAGPPGGGGAPKHESRTLQLADLPLAAQRALLERANGATIERIVPYPVFYAVDLTLNGKELRVWANENGTALEGPAPRKRPGEAFQGTTIGWSDLPPAVQNLVSTKFHGNPLGEIRKTPVMYIATIKQGAEERPIRITEDGQVLPMGRRVRHGENAAPADEEIKVRHEQEKEQALLNGQVGHQPSEQMPNEGPVPHRRAPKE